MNLLKVESHSQVSEAVTVAAVCQCCMTRTGTFRSILREYSYKGVKEIYLNMLYECFSIQVGPPISDATLICVACANSLRKTQQFKHRVMNSQEKLKNILKSQCISTENFYVKQEFPQEDINGSPMFFDDNKELQAGDPILEVDTKGELFANNSDESEDNYFDVNDKTSAQKSELSSDEILKEALERTRRNLKLLNASLPEEKHKDLECIQAELIIRAPKLGGPENKLQRKNYLQRQRYAKKMPFKLEKTDRTCKVCGIFFATYRKLITHMPEHYPNHICNYCGKLFIYKCNLERHIFSTHTHIKVECPTCNKLMKKDSLRRHMSIHTGNRFLYRCSYCPEKFTSYSKNIIHMSNKHGHKGDEHKCAICSKVYKLSSELTNHMKAVHLGEKKNKCAECDRHFFNKYKLKQHMVKHTQERNYQCDICHKKYGRKYTLDAHMKIHNNVKNHVCTVCERAFTQKCTLQAHMKTHDR